MGDRVGGREVLDRDESEDTGCSLSEAAGEGRVCLTALIAHSSLWVPV